MTVTHTLCERGRGRREGEREEPSRDQRCPHPPHIHTDTHTPRRSGRHLGDEETHTCPLMTTDRNTRSGGRGTGGLTWAWQLLSSFTVSPSPWRSLSTNTQKKWFLAHLPSTSRDQSPEDQSRRAGREQQSRGREGPLPAPGAPSVPQPRETTSGAPTLLRSLGERSPG